MADKLRAIFNGMNTDQKGQFIINLKKTLEGNSDPANKQFLDECIEQYNKELQTTTQPSASETEPPVEGASVLSTQERESAFSQPADNILAAETQNPVNENEPQSVDITAINAQDSVDVGSDAHDATESKIDNAAKKVSSLVESVQNEVSASETIANIKTTAGSQIDTAARKTSELVDILPDNISSSETAAKVKEKLQGSNSRTYMIIGAICLIAAVALILFVPFVRWIVLILALGWVGFSFYKKANKVLPIAAAVIALALIIVLPSGGAVGSGGGSSGRSTSSSSTSDLDFSTREKVQAYFEMQYPQAYQVTIAPHAARGYDYHVNVNIVGRDIIRLDVRKDGYIFER